MANQITSRTWFDNCGGFEPAHDLATLRAGIAAGLLDQQDEYGMTALYFAVVSGWLEGVQELLQAGANTELRDHRTGATALLNAVQYGTAEMIAALLAVGANVDAGNHFGLTPRKWREVRGHEPFADIPKQTVQLPEPRIQNAEHLADHHYPQFKIPNRDEREALVVGTAVNLYVYGPKVEGKQNTVKVRITARAGRRPNVRYTAAVETPTEQTNLPADTTVVEFGPENVATVYIQKPQKPKKRKNA
ncbi:MAG: ankyrin repeat domain-containing protein [Planctomycetes bacterium]|nr:ankyrin repeat domain-containing protein [Planctomycetota bacterium]